MRVDVALNRLSQLDLFIATATDLSPKSHQDMMSRNWLSLSKHKRVEPIHHEFQDNWVKITGNDRFGIATIFDYDLLIFVGAQLMNAINRGQKTGRRLQFTGYEYFQFTGKKRYGGSGYADLWKSMQRLHHTFVETNIRLGNTNTHHSFNWLSEIKQIREGDISRGYEIVIPEWFYESITNKKMVLTLDEDYFKIRGGFERWLYLFARKTSGWQSGGWSESIRSIYRKSASTGSLSEFTRKVKKIAEKDSLLEYSVELVGENERGTPQAIHFLRKSQFLEMVASERSTSARNGASQWRDDRNILDNQDKTIRGKNS